MPIHLIRRELEARPDSEAGDCMRAWIPGCMGHGWGHHSGPTTLMFVPLVLRGQSAVTWMEELSSIPIHHQKGSGKSWARCRRWKGSWEHQPLQRANSIGFGSRIWMLNPSPASKPASWALELTKKSLAPMRELLLLFPFSIWGNLTKLPRITVRKWYSWNLNPDISNAKAAGHFMVYSLRNFPRVNQRNTEIQFSTHSW